MVTTRRHTGATAAAGCAGALVSAFGVWTGSFAVLCAGGVLSGAYMAGNGLFRFAAVDTASDAFRPKAISYVLAGGLAAAGGLAGGGAAGLLRARQPLECRGRRGGAR